MTELSQEQLEALYEQSSNNNGLSQDQLKTLYENSVDTSSTQSNDIDKTIGQSIEKKARPFVAGAVNQWNIFPKLLGALSSLQSDSLAERWGANKIAPTGIDDETWKEASVTEKYKLAKNQAQSAINKIEDENPISYALGNAAGQLVSTAPLGAFGSGAGLATKGAQALKSGKALTSVEKLYANALGNAIESGAQGAVFSRDDSNTLDDALGASGFGFALPVVGRALTKTAKKVGPAVADFFMGAKKKEARLYRDRIKDIKKQRASGELPIETTEDQLNEKILQDRTNYTNDITEFSDDVSTAVKKANTTNQLDTQRIQKDMRQARKQIQKDISKDSGRGYNVLTDKEVDIEPIKNQLKEEIALRDPIDPVLPELQKVLDRLEKDPKKFTEKKLKTFYKTISDIAYADADSVKYTPLTQRILRNTARISRDILSESNPEYAKIAKPISEKISLLDRLDEVYDLDKVTPNMLRGYADSLDQQQAVEILENLSGKKFAERILKNNQNYDYINAIDVSDIDKFSDKLINATEDSSNLQILKRTLKRFDDVYGTNLEKRYSNIRVKNQIPEVEEMLKLATERNGKTKFRKNLEGLESDKVGEQTSTQQFFEGDETLDYNPKRTKDKLARETLNKVAKYLGTNADDLTKKVENEKILNVLEYGDPSGSKNVNFSIQQAKGLATALGLPVEQIGSLGGLLGKEVDKGRLSRLYKRFVDVADDVSSAYNGNGNFDLYNLNKILPLGDNIPHFNFDINRAYEGGLKSTIPLTRDIRLDMRNEENKLNRNNDNYYNDDFYYATPARQVERQQDINEKYFGR